MTTYGILIIDTSWSNQNTAQIEKTAFLRYQSLIGKGAKALIYMREPVDAVVAEAEVTSNVIETEAELLNHAELPVNRDNSQARMTDEPILTTLNVGIADDFHVPLNLLRTKGPQTPPISLERLKTILGKNFSVYDETWIPLSEDQYNEIIAIWST
jgi:hypothetical protein